MASDRARGMLRNGDLTGRVIDAFVLSQLRPEAELVNYPIRLYHLRLDTGRREVDCIAKAHDGRISAIEVKSSSALKPSDAEHRVRLKEKLGK